MKRLLFVAATFAAWLPVFAVQKPLFMLYHHTLAQGCSVAEWLQVITHGLRLDCTVAGYATIIPILCAIASVWLPTKVAALRTLVRVYFATAATLIALIFAADMALYGFWGFRMDATVLFYSKYPSQALASIPVWLVVRQGVVGVLYGAAVYYGFSRVVAPLLSDGADRRAGRAAVGLLVCAALLIIPIRGSVTTSTANVGMVYFSHRQFLNHAAINPTFSLFTSLFKQQDFASQFRFFPEAERDSIFQALYPPPVDRPVPTLLNTPRPDILLIVLESFSANVVGALGGEAGVTPCLNRLCSEGLLFADFYAGSFRTDRGLVALLNGYPAQPTTSVMKYPAKSQSLPSLAKVLGEAGYRSTFVYGGDVNFTNMRSYLYASGFGRVVSDKDFPLVRRLSKWGAGDDVTFPFVLRLLTNNRSNPSPSVNLLVNSQPSPSLSVNFLVNSQPTSKPSVNLLVDGRTGSGTFGGLLADGRIRGGIALDRLADRWVSLQDALGRLADGWGVWAGEGGGLGKGGVKCSVTRTLPVSTEASPVLAMASPVLAMASPVLAMASPVLAGASPVLAMASPVLAMASHLSSEASHLTAEASHLTAEASQTVGRVEQGVAWGEGPTFTVFLTLSSHEPFDVPYRRLEDPYLNAVAFSDSCLGAFIEGLRGTAAWENLLVIITADHGYRYPGTLAEYEPGRYRIPMVWLGGALKPISSSLLALLPQHPSGQTDLAATLLGQLALPIDSFVFSHNLLGGRGGGFGFYTFVNGFGYVDGGGAAAYDNDGESVVFAEPADGWGERIKKGKAILQSVYDDLSRR